MKPVMQTLFHDKDGTGNCFEACLASIFEMDLKYVPNFHCENWFGKFLEWLKTKGYTTYGSLYDIEIEKYSGGIDGYFIVVGESPRGKHIKGGHAVVYKKGKMAHDPHPEGTGVVSIKYVMSIEKEMKI
jgi:hypothetical protein